MCGGGGVHVEVHVCVCARVCVSTGRVFSRVSLAASIQRARPYLLPTTIGTEATVKSYTTREPCSDIKWCVTVNWRTG